MTDLTTDKQFTIINQGFYLAADGKVYEVCWQMNKEDLSVYMLAIHRETRDGIRLFEIEEINIKD